MLNEGYDSPANLSHPVSKPKPQAGSGQRQQPGDQQAFEREGRVPIGTTFAPEFVTPIPKMLLVTPRSIGGEEPVLGGRTDQESGEVPLRSQEKSEENGPATEHQGPVAEPTPAVSNPAAEQINPERRDDQKQGESKRDEMRNRVIDRSEARLAGEKGEYPAHHHHDGHVNQSDPGRGPTRF